MGIRQSEDWYEKMRRCRSHFLETGEVDPAVRPAVAESWRRCRQMDLDLSTSYRLEKLGNEERERLLKKNEGLIQAAHPILKTVVSLVDDHHAILDVGTKILTSDLCERHPGYGTVIGRPDMVITALNEEHAFLESASPLNVKIGDKEDTDKLTFVRLTPTSGDYGFMAMRSFLLFDRDLTEQEIEWVKTNLIEGDTEL